MSKYQNKCMSVLGIQEILYNVIQYTNYQDFLNLRQTNKDLYYLTRGYDEQYILNHFRDKTSHDINTIPIFNLYEMIKLKNILNLFQMPLEEIKIHDYKIFVTDRPYSGYTPEEAQLISHFETISYHHLTLYYKGYHRLKCIVKKPYGVNSTGHNTECKLYYSRLGFGDRAYDDYTGFFGTRTFKGGSFRSTAAYLPGIDLFMVIFLKNYAIPKADSVNEDTILLTRKDLLVLEKELIKKYI